MEVNYGFLIERTAKKIKQTLQKVFNELKVDITVDQWVILNELNQHGPLSQNELGNFSFKDAPTVTRIIDLLSKKDLVKRKMDKNDRRKYNVELTAKGNKMVNKLLPYIVEFRKMGWEGLTEKDIKKLQKILDKVFDNMT